MNVRLILAILMRIVVANIRIAHLEQLQAAKNPREITRTRDSTKMVLPNSGMISVTPRWAIMPEDASDDQLRTIG